MSVVATISLLVGSVAAQHWTFLDAPFESARMAAFASHRQRLVWFGADGETWELAGTELLRRQPDSSPPPRRDGIMVYDAARRHVLLFGGWNASGTTFGDTWTWDGVNWTALTAGPQPAPRIWAGAAYDSARQRVVLQGGVHMGSSVFTDTWEHDGAQWVPRPSATANGSTSMVMAYDAARAVTVLVELRGAYTPVRTWIWDGVDWHVAASAGPIRDIEASVAYDELRNVVVLWGSRGDPNVWEWNGFSWTPRVATTGPLREQPAVYFDASRARVVAVGGNEWGVVAGSASNLGMRTDVWEWDGVAAQLVVPDRVPSQKLGRGVCADFARGELLLFGGDGYGQLQPAETWTWAGAWTRRQPATQPSARFGAAMAWDPLGQRVVMFGGETASGPTAELWSWNGSDWTLLDPGTGPSPRSASGLAFDAGRAVLVLTAGAQGISLSDVWEWNGASWTQRPSLPAPLASRSPGSSALAFDPTRNRVLWYGGVSSFSGFSLSDTWEYDGTTWTPLTLLGAPSLMRPCLVPDPIRGRVLLTGKTPLGWSFPTPPTYSRLYALVNDTWTQLASEQVGTFEGVGVAVMDPVRQRLLSVNGRSLREWSETLAQTTTHGSGCGSPMPRICLRTRARIGAPGFGFEVHGPGAQPTVFAIADATGSLPLGSGCTVHVGGTVVLQFVPSSASGITELLVPIPSVAALRGLTLYGQAAVLDTTAPTGLRLTGGRRFVIGD